MKIIIETTETGKDGKEEQSKEEESVNHEESGHENQASTISRVCLNLLWDDKTHLNLARSLFFITQNSPCTATATGLSWAAQRRRPHIHHPSHSTVMQTYPYLDHRPCPAIHVTSRAQSRFCACYPSFHTCPQRHVP